VSGCSDGAYVFGPGALGTFTRVERDLLAFTELVEADAREAGLMEEYVLASTSVDESEALVCQTLDRTLCHLWLFLKSVRREAWAAKWQPGMTSR